jgi:hypothetical protein
MAEPLMPDVYNHDVVGIYNRLNRFIVEIFRSVSANVSQMNAFDQARLQSYLDGIRNYVSWVIAQPQLDLPETTPRKYVLETPPVVPDVESEEVSDLLRMLILSRDELTDSQSSRTGSGLIPFDHARFMAVIDKSDAFLKTYIQVTSPLDLPESSPDELIVPR